MAQGLRLNRFGLRPLVLAVVCAVALPAGAGATVLGPKRHGPLSPNLQVLSKPAVRSLSRTQQAAAVGLPASGPGSLVRLGSKLLVEVGFDRGGAAPVDELRQAGAEVASVSRRYRSATAAVPPSALGPVAGIAGVRSVRPVRAPMILASCEGGSVISEGVAQIHAKAARDEFGLDGEGVTVGVLSDSYDRASGAATEAKDDVESEDLPGLGNECLEQKMPVDVLKDLSPSEEGSDEGRAMLQIVHDVAPAAKLAFASAYFGEEAFAQSIEELAAPVISGGAGAKVVVDDIAYLEEPFFQDGPIAAAINKVTGEGATYLSAAGNDNLLDSAGREIASWEAPAFRDSNSCPAAVQGLSGFNGTHCMDFAPGAGTTDTTFSLSVESGQELLLGLQWAEPWFGVGTDMDAFLLNGSGNQVLSAAYEENIDGTQRSGELLDWENGSSSPRTVQLVVNRYAGGNPRLKFVLFENGAGVSAVEYPESRGGDVVGPTVFGHAGAASAIGVGAIPFSNSSKVERYSSRGPVTHYFAEVEGAIPAPALGSAQVIPKPDIAATDCGRTTFFASESSAGVWRFCGTSAAAPHAAGAAALLVEAGEGAGGGLDEPEAIRSALIQSASPVGTFGACAVGGGLVETRGAVEALLADPGPAPALACSPPSSPPVEEPQPGPVEPAQTTTTNTEPVPGPPPPPTTGEVPPKTEIIRHPSKLVRTDRSRARVVFGFGSDQRGATFLCKVDRSAFRPCPARLVRRLAVGAHVVKVKARSVGGLTDPTPAAFRFRIVRS